ncbi:MAG: class I SAM-dependent methyltransferase [Desulfuromonadaceae bacterium]|nr:class I SAM-dependent methyltransferase [Desulfuromonadaceae bacterium]MDD5105068.1 class I SAM-dependent methyltransferase [Desulfuromonadaceae bacterium]
MSNQTNDKGHEMNNKNSRICPVERAGSLDNNIRKWLQNPQKILRPYIEEGMTVLDIGCGPGFFTIDMARMVGESGQVIAVDLQEGMLQKLRTKIQGAELGKRIRLHKSEKDRIGLSEKGDFALAFYVVHEFTNQDEFFKELISLLKPQGLALVVEPPLHVSKSAFEETIQIARDAGFTQLEGPKIFISKSVLLRNG